MKHCKYCGAEIESSEYRDDKTYCDSSTCRAKYHREIGRGYRGDVTEHLVHENLLWQHNHACAECGSTFFVNDYAERTGERVPLYCSAKCKQRAYRKRKKDA